MNEFDPLALERDAPEGWFSQYDIEAMKPDLLKMGLNTLYLEVGVHKGRSLWVARKLTAPGVEVWGIDTAEDPRIKGTNFVQADSLEVEWKFPIDILFIDANHHYDWVTADIKKFVPYVKQGGVVFFHDYDETSPGVVRAVNEFAEEIDTPIETFNNKSSVVRIQL